MKFKKIFLSSPSACLTSGASKNSDWTDKMMRPLTFVKLINSLVSELFLVPGMYAYGMFTYGMYT